MKGFALWLQISRNQDPGIGIGIAGPIGPIGPIAPILRIQQHTEQVPLRNEWGTQIWDMHGYPGGK